MVQLNLLPDVKKEFLKAQRTKRNIISFSIITAVVVGVSVLLLALYVHGAQRIARAQLQKDIDSSAAELQSLPDVAKVVTVQGALSALPALHDGTYKNSRFFEYLKVLVPGGVSLSRSEVVHGNSRLRVTGRSDDYKALNTFVDTLKGAQLAHGPKDSRTIISPFKEVTVVSANASPAAQKPGIEFNIELAFDPVIFATTTQEPVMSVPNTTTGQGFVKQDQLFSGSPEGAQ